MNHTPARLEYNERAQGRARSQRMARSNVTACLRCKQKKKRCDGTLPKCSLCQSAGVECVSWDAVAGRKVPRSYVQSLEDRIAYLELKLHEYGASDPQSTTQRSSLTTPPLVTAVSREASLATDMVVPHPLSAVPESAYLEDITHTVGSVRDLTQRGPPQERTYSRILLTELMKLRAARPSTANGTTALDVEDQQASTDSIFDLDTSPISLPTQEGSQRLVKAYFQFANLSLPLLHEPTFQEKVDRLYTMPRTIDLVHTHKTADIRNAMFFVFEVFAVALLTLQKQEPSRIPISLADRYHQTALKALAETGLPEGVEGIQALLLVAQYSYHHPTIWTVWKTVGAALRSAVELGMHRDPLPSTLDCLTIDTMRRTFWVAYAMDRNISIALGQPSCLSDCAITAKFPSDDNDDCITINGILPSASAQFRPKIISHHVFRFRQIQSEMQTVLYESHHPAFGPVDLGRWQENMHNRIHRWFSDTPSSQSANGVQKRVLENFELTFHRALFYLYHPSCNIPAPSESALITLADAATNMIQLYKRFFPEHRLTIYWQAVENLYAAGIGLMYSFAYSEVVRSRVSLRALDSLVHTCSSVLWGLVEHFPDFKGKRDAFDLVASKVLADLNGSDTLAAQDTLAEYAERSLSQGTQDTEFAPPSTGSRERERPTPTQPLQAANSGTLAAPEPFTFSDFDNVDFDWQSLESMSDLFTPSWL